MRVGPFSPPCPEARPGQADPPYSSLRYLTRDEFTKQHHSQRQARKHHNLMRGKIEADRLRYIHANWARFQGNVTFIGGSAPW